MMASELLYGRSLRVSNLKRSRAGSRDFQNILPRRGLFYLFHIETITNIRNMHKYIYTQTYSNIARSFMK